MEGDISILPPEIISMILTEVDQKSILYCRLVCHHWKTLLKYRWNNRRPNYKLNIRYIIGSKGKEDGQFNRPSSIVLDKKGNLFVTDTNNHRIQVFDNKGQFIRKWGEKGKDEGQFNRPCGITLNIQ